MECIFDSAINVGEAADVVGSYILFNQEKFMSEKVVKRFPNSKPGLIESYGYSFWKSTESSVQASTMRLKESSIA